MGKLTGESISDKQLGVAAYLRRVKDNDWETIADAIQTTEDTLRAVRRTERWEKACEPYNILKCDLRETAYVALERKVREGDVAAIKEALARTEGAVSQSLGLHGEAGKPPVAFAHLTAEEAMAILGNGGPYKHQGDEAGDEPGDGGTDASN